MANTAPFSQLTGALKVYVAPVGETVNVVNTTPVGNWVELASTDGEQSMQVSGKLTYFRDNDHQGPTKAVRPEEDAIYKFKLVSLTLENLARALSTVANIVEAVGPPATKKFPLKRGETPQEYAMLFRGLALSPYGPLPGQFVVPRGIFDNEPTMTFGKDKRAELDCEFHALEDDAQPEADRLGYLIVQAT